MSTHMQKVRGKRSAYNKLLKLQGVIRVTEDQCMYGLKANDGTRDGPARKRTGFMTNSPCTAKRLNRQCPNTREKRIHDHVILVNGRAKAAEVYPEQLCRIVCEGLMEQDEIDRLGQFLIVEVINDDNYSGRSMEQEADQQTMMKSSSRPGVMCQAQPWIHRQ